MKKFRVVVAETQYYEVYVEANTEEEAEDIAMGVYIEDGDIFSTQLDTTLVEEEMQMKIQSIEHIDDFGMHECLCWTVVDGVPTQFIEEAKAIDGDNYCEACFGICVGSDEDGWFVNQDDINCELYYIDNNGDKHWMNYKLTEQEEADAIAYCKKYVGEEEA